MLSRFRTRAEQDEVIAGLASGTVDIVIGTHRLLSGDVEFSDLGLLIVDEEQRFGVTHKEQLKQMRTEVDVLTLTATPIPRTLYMSLAGVRDISVIDTAPEERLPIRTYVGDRDEGMIRQAILRELDRGGQVFYVHNRVQSIESERRRLQRLVPEAVFAIAHGQMNEHELEHVMERFAACEVDVLVTTSIIEAGLDFPNANTLIVDRADRFGLAQLYQLRGRVGRSASRAFAYFFHPTRVRLTPEARARLETIAEHTELGAGFNIAMRDLEIRGAGEILGVRQSGSISAIGFHLYTQMLGQAIRQMRRDMEGASPAGEQDLTATPVTIELPIPTYLPTDYIPDMALRIQLYRRMANLPDESAISDLRDELDDRFGPLPPPVDNLLYQLRVKQLARDAAAEGVVSEGQQISIRLAGLAHVDRRALQGRLGHDVRVSRTAVWLPRMDEGGWQPALIEILRKLAAERLQAGVD
jgi:transcription-repair coupling factor (superfamily II helicase)